MPQYVYLLQELNFNRQPTGLYKIGMTTVAVESRIRQYKAGNVRPLKVYYFIAVMNAQVVETKLHRAFANSRLALGGGDEWFKFSDVDLDSVLEEMDAFDLSNGDAYAAYLDEYGDEEDEDEDEDEEYEESYSPSSAYSYSYSSSAGDGMEWVIGIGSVVLIAIAFVMNAGGIMSSLGTPTRIEVTDFGGVTANVRSAPSRNAHIMTSIEDETPITVYELSADGQWRKVRLPDGRIGWVASNLVK